jgi:hypothetical protein
VAHAPSQERKSSPPPSSRTRPGITWSDTVNYTSYHVVIKRGFKILELCLWVLWFTSIDPGEFQYSRRKWNFSPERLTD